MPGRFPLTPVPLTNDSFCENAFFGNENFVRATGFGNFEVFYSVSVERGVETEFLTASAGQTDRYVPQNLVPIFASRVTSKSLMATLGSSALPPRFIPYVGTARWSIDPALDALELMVDVNFGVTFDPFLFRIVKSNSDVNVVSGLICFNIATLVCNTAPFTGQTYGQAIVGYEETNTAAFGSGPTTIGPGVGSVTIGDRYQGKYDAVPPLPHRPWFQAYVDQSGGTVSANPLYQANRSAKVILVPYSSVKTTLERVSANRFRLHMDRQAVGGIMVLRYNVSFNEDTNTFDGGFYGPTTVTIPADKREAFFNVTPGIWATIGYTVTLETCFGLRNLIDAQFWPLEPDPIQFEASGP
jgi:hypothetical protein